MSGHVPGVQVDVGRRRLASAPDGGATRRPPSRSHRVPRWLFTHRADLLAALVYGCLAFLSFSALAGYTNAHQLPDGTALFPDPWGGYALAVAVDGSVLYAFVSFKRAPWLAGTLLVSGAAATYTLQRWHAQGALHPLMVAGVVPSLMVLVTFAWHRIRSRPDWPIPVPEAPAPEEAPDARPPEPVQPVPAPAYRDTAPERAKTRGGPTKTSTERTRAFRERERAKKAALTTSRNGDGS